MWVWNKSFSIISKNAYTQTIFKWWISELFISLRTKLAPRKGVNITLCWANIKTLCCPMPTAFSVPEASTPIPHSSRISWRATSFGEWWSLWSSEMTSEPAGNSSKRMVESESGIFPPSTSNGWLQSFSKYWSAWKMEWVLGLKNESKNRLMEHNLLVKI